MLALTHNPALSTWRYGHSFTGNPQLDLAIALFGVFLFVMKIVSASRQRD